MSILLLAIERELRPWIPALEFYFDLGRSAALDLPLQAAAISLIFGLPCIFAPEITLLRAQRVTNSGLPEQLEPELPPAAWSSTCLLSLPPYLTARWGSPRLAA
jgi:hypothetical protein